MTGALCRYLVPRPLRLVLTGFTAASCLVATLISASQLLQARSDCFRAEPACEHLP